MALSSLSAPGVANATTGITSLANLILVTPQDIGYYAQNAPIPAGAPQPEDAQREIGLLFHYEGENTATLESDITDHYVENNSTISDQISIKPEIITVQGFVGELTDALPKYNSLVKGIQSKLTQLSPYAPEFTTSALIAINEAILAYQVVANATTAVQQTLAWGSGANQPKNKFVNKQQYYFGQFYSWWKNRNLFTIQTPWAIFDNMAVKSLKAVQSGDTRMITDFEITFKKMYFINPQVVVNNATGRGASQRDTEFNSGPNSVNPARVTFTSQYQSMSP